MKYSNEKLISVIVPIYNVVDYLEMCVDSIINQTYDNLEILLIDDGSNDGSEILCDNYKNIDNRIVVIHKENGGQSSARNVGLKCARGEYIGFVDSDDYIEPDMYETLYFLCKNNDIPLSCARFNCFEFDWNLIVPRQTNIIEMLSAREMLDAVIPDGINSPNDRFASFSVWDRLYRRDIVDNVSFPEGKSYEDIIFSIKTIINAKKCMYINKSLYNYRLRKGSVSAVIKEFDNKRFTDKIPMEKECISFLESCGFNDLAIKLKLSAYLDARRLLLKCKNKNIYTELQKECIVLKPSIKQIIFAYSNCIDRIKNIIKVKFAKLIILLYP